VQAAVGTASVAEAAALLSAGPAAQLVVAKQRSTDATVAIARRLRPEGHLAVAAWRFAAPGSASAARTVLAAKAGTEQPTQVRLASLVPASDSDDDPVSLVTLSHVAAGSLRLVSWRLHKSTLVYSPVGSTPIGIGTKP